MEQAFEIARSLRHGHVLEQLGSGQTLGIDTIWAAPAVPGDERKPCPGAGNLGHTSLGCLLGVEDGDEEELHSALDWLLERAPKVELGLITSPKGCPVGADVFEARWPIR